MVVALVALGLLLVREHRKAQKRESEALNRKAAAAAAAMAEMTEAATAVPTSAAITEEVAPIAEEPKGLAALDAPMIQARVGKLGLLSGHGTYDAEQLRRSILDHCRQGKVGLWWEPLKGFARVGQSRSGITVVDAAGVGFAPMTRTLIALSKGLENTNVKLESLQDRRGEPLTPASWSNVSTDSCNAAWEWGSRSGTIPVEVRNGVLDVQAFARSLNGLLSRIGLNYRFLVLAPNADTWCTIVCEIDAAERAASARWGQLLMPVPEEA
jgi:hypothetical protein